MFAFNFVLYYLKINLACIIYKSKKIFWIDKYLFPLNKKMYIISIFLYFSNAHKFYDCKIK